MRSAGGSALLILYGSNCLILRAWWQSPLSSSSSASTPNLRLIVENHVQQGTVVKAFVPIAPSALSSDCSVPGVHNENILSAMGF